jgi:hypothetical protein
LDKKTPFSHFNAEAQILTQKPNPLWLLKLRSRDCEGLKKAWERRRQLSGFISIGPEAPSAQAISPG